MPDREGVSEVPAPGSERALHSLLGRILSSEIDAEFLAVLGVPRVREVFETLEPGCLEIDLEDAAAEYCRLFILPKGVPPVASAWLPGDGVGRASVIAGLVSNLQSSLDLALPDGLALDHAGVLLPLGGWLRERQPESGREFADVALAPWLPAFAAALRDRARVPVYRATGEILLSLG